MQELLNFSSWSLWVLLVVLVVAGAAIWFAGTRLSNYADTISQRTGLGQAFVGLLLLAVSTSLPEVATTITGALRGHPDIVASNLMGGIALQTAILAVVDWVVVRGALTRHAGKAVLLLQGALLLLLLSLALAGFAVGELLSLYKIGLWPTLMLVGYLLTLYAVHKYQGNPRWQPKESTDKEPTDGDGRQNEDQKSDQRKKDERQRKDNGQQQGMQEQQKEKQRPLSRIYWYFAIGAAVVLVAGWTVIHTSNAIAQELGLAGSFVGATFVAIATSLPEVSTTYSAARRGNYSMAISNIFGSNALMVGLFFIADLFYREGLILADVERAVMFLTALGALVTAVYLWGLLERLQRTIMRLGIDSALVVGLYIAGLAVTYTLGSGQSGRSGMQSTQGGVSVQEVLSRPREYLHTQVVMSGRVREVLSERAFVLAGGGARTLLVLQVDELAGVPHLGSRVDTPVFEGESIRAAGAVAILDIERFEETLGVSFPEAGLYRFQGESVLLALVIEANP